MSYVLLKLMVVCKPILAENLKANEEQLKLVSMTMEIFHFDHG